MQTKFPQRPPFLYRLAKAADRRKITGSWRLFQVLQACNLLPPVDFPLTNGISVIVPIAMRPYDLIDVSQYESEFIQAIAAAISNYPGPFTFIDGGADIGMFSTKLYAACPRISRIIAFEPNPTTRAWAVRNLSRLPIKTEVLPVAISDFEGRGALEAPPGQYGNATAQYLVPSSAGPFQVVTVDSMNIEVGSDLLFKLDLEGGELAALRGSINTIRKATNAVIAVEAHPEVAKRCGIDPVECLRVLEQVRPFEFYAAEGDVKIHTRAPLFAQIPPTQIYNLIARSL